MDGISLDQLEGTAIAFLDLAESIGRPLLPSERHAFRWILIAFESDGIKKSARSLDEETLAYHSQLIGNVRSVLIPDPVKQTHFRREKPEEVAVLNNGNYSVKAAPFRGVSIRRMNAAEAMERAALLAKMGEGMAALVRELALVRLSDSEEAAQIARAARRLMELAGAFAARCKATPTVIPAEPSISELMDNARKMNALMKPEKTNGAH